MCLRYVRDCLQDAAGRRVAELKPATGQYTDDSQLVRELKQSYVQIGVYLGLDVLPLDLAARMTDRGTWGLAS